MCLPEKNACIVFLVTLNTGYCTSSLVQRERKKRMGYETTYETTKTATNQSAFTFVLLCDCFVCSPKNLALHSKIRSQ